VIWKSSSSFRGCCSIKRFSQKKKNEKFVLIFAEIVVDTLVPWHLLTLIILFSHKYFSISFWPFHINIEPKFGCMHAYLKTIWVNHIHK
jgi:hypothetical protein